jgi:glycosyltransferase involved in cell wall biosynthesis
LNETGVAPFEPSQTSDSERPLRVAFFTETFLPRIDGTVTRLCQTIRHLREFGHAVLVIAPEGGPADFEGARIHGVPGFRFPLYPELKLAIPRSSVGRTLEAFRPDLIQAIHPVLLGVSGFYYSSARRVPLVVSYHCQLHRYVHYYGLGYLERLVWWAIKSAYNRADLTLATSRIMQAELQKHGVRRVKLWRRGVDTQLFHPQRSSHEMRARLTQGHSEEKLLLYVGRLSAEKEIEQCRPVLAGVHGLRLALVGDGPHRGKLEQYFGGTPTYFAGYMEGTELAAAYASADVFLLPSPTEALGLVLLEAMAAGCPVVAAGTGGILDIVRDGITGHLYDPSDRSGPLSAVRRLLDDSTHRNSVRQQARLDAKQWSWSASTRQLVGFYRTVIEREQELPRQIREHCAPAASPENICEALQISRATLRRHIRGGSMERSA